MLLPIHTVLNINILNRISSPSIPPIYIWSVCLSTSQCVICFLSVCMSMCSSVYLSVCLSFCRSAGLPAWLSVWLCAFLSAWRLCESLRVYLWLSVCEEYWLVWRRSQGTPQSAYGRNNAHTPVCDSFHNTWTDIIAKMENIRHELMWKFPIKPHPQPVVCTRISNTSRTMSPPAVNSWCQKVR